MIGLVSYKQNTCSMLKNRTSFNYNDNYSDVYVMQVQVQAISAKNISQKKTILSCSDGSILRVSAERMSL